MIIIYLTLAGYLFYIKNFFSFKKKLINILIFIYTKISKNIYDFCNINKLIFDYKNNHS